MNEQLIKRLKRTNQLLEDLVTFIPEEKLDSKLAHLPSNTIGQQYWCIIGARKSYLLAAKAGKWNGFECGLTNEDVKIAKTIKSALAETCNAAIDFLNQIPELTEPQEDFFLDLLEHETQHHGQLIRYFYGLNIGAPNSWKQRYSLD